MKIAEYVTLPKQPDPGTASRLLAAEPDIAGLEIFMTDLVDRTQPLPSGAEAASLVTRLRDLGVRRVHCSYWGSPTSFLTKVNFRELVERFGSRRELRAYYADLTGTHMLRRWADEYALARELGADTYVFHLIDYATVDGAWSFTHHKETIRRAMASMLQLLLAALEERGLLDATSPLVEVENAGWGLEHGMQTAQDAEAVLVEVDDPHDRLRVGWDINHLLHALGVDPETRCGRFLLPPAERTDAMRALEDDCGCNPERLARAWVEHNVKARALRGRLGALHVSDCALKEFEYFSNGALNPPFRGRQEACRTIVEQQSYGLQIVLEHYDSHLPLGQGCLDGRWLAELVDRLAPENPDLAVLHELKNSTDLLTEVREQRTAMHVASAGRSTWAT